MATEYKLLNIEKPGDRIHEVEAIINKTAQEGWEVVGYAAHGFRGMVTAGYSHLVLFKRTG